MIAYRVEIWCDGGHCQEVARGPISSRDSIVVQANNRRDLLELTSKLGWTTKDGKHYCPPHKEAPTSQ